MVMHMKKILFLIHDLHHGGAEKVLVNLVNNMDPTKFEIHVTALFGGGVNEQFLKPHVRFRTIFPKSFPGNSHIMKLLTPRQLHRLCIKEHYDIEVSYLEGPCARIISGCTDPTTKKVCWIHVQQNTRKCAAASFRSYREALACYNSFDRIVCVSDAVRKDFLGLLPVNVPTDVRYNTNESAQILASSADPVEAGLFSGSEIKLVGVGKLMPNKGFQRIIPIVKKLRDTGCPAHLYILGVGPMEAELKRMAAELGIEDAVTMLGYQTNPYKYVAKCDLFVCASYAEGFSTAATEALIVGTPVCTVEVSGMKEMLGSNNEWGIVTENDENALYQGIKRLLDDPALLEHYKKQAAERGKTFSTENTVRAVRDMLLETERY